MAEVVVIGAGVGGLSAALRLAHLGHNVTVVERDQPGGKLHSMELGQFRFDIGPSLLTLPDVVGEPLAINGHRLEDNVDLVRLEHPFRHHFADGSELDVFDDAQATRSSFGEFAPGADEQWQEFMARSERCWEVAQRTFFAGPMRSPLGLLRRMRTPKDFVEIDALSTLSSRSAKTFDDPRLQQWLNRFATYSGSDPWKCPATLGCIAHVEQHYGAWHVQGGLAKIADAMVRVAEVAGIKFVHADAEHIEARMGAVRSVSLDTGSRVRADIVVAGVDARTVYQKLLPNQLQARRVSRGGRSTGGFAMLLGLNGRSAKPVHHNLYYSANQKHEFAQIREQGWADDPTLYVCNATATDSSMAPADSESLFVLVNTGADASTDWAKYGNSIIERLGIGARVRQRLDISPADMAARFGTEDGAIYGSSSNGRRAAFLRAPNRGVIRGLYFCGGSAHPGGGLPLVATSGRIVAEMINKDGF